MKVAVCDDVKEDREQLKKALYQLEKEKNIEFDIHEYDNPKALYSVCSERENLQIVFLDVYMGDELGTDAARKMREAGYSGSIIFCTTSEDHALEGFRVQADGYLVKPYTYDEFKDSLYRLQDLFGKETRKISFMSERIEYDIPVSDVLLIETSNKGCIVHTTGGQLFTWTKLKEFAESSCGDCFYRLGRFYLLNLNAIDRVKEDTIFLKNGTGIDMPKREANRIRQDINDYFWNSMRR